MHRKNSFRPESRQLKAVTLRGVTLMDTLVGIALLCLVFVGIYGVFLLSIDVVINNKARIGALALASEQMEYIRSLPYASVGTLGGIPSGTVVQDESVTINGVPYSRHTLVRYVDLPQDGQGAADTNGIIADVKQAEVDVSWSSKGNARTLSLVSFIAPAGIESLVPGGTISVTVRTADDQIVPGASVRVVNASTSPTIDVTTTSNVSGQVVFIGAPAASEYRITVTKDGYSTAQTYSASVSLPTPNPGNLTVSLNQTTGATFKIDVLGSYFLRTFEQISSVAWEDLFVSESLIATSTNTEVTGGHVALVSGESSGSVTSDDVSPAYLFGWTSASWVDTTTVGNTIVYRVYSAGVLVPDGELPGNASGFTLSPVDLSGLSTSTNSALALRATLTGDGVGGTPEIESWSIDYRKGPEPLPDIPYTLVGEKTIGSTGAGAPVYKYDASGNSGSTGEVMQPGMEWDTYTLSVPASSGYDIASSCTPQPTALNPGVALSTSVYLAPHTTHSLLVDIRTDTGVLITDGSVVLSRASTSFEEAADTCGQAFFPGLSSGTEAGGNPYTLTVTASGFQNHISTVDVSGTSRISVVMVP